MRCTLAFAVAAMLQLVGPIGVPRQEAATPTGSDRQRPTGAQPPESISDWQLGLAKAPVSEDRAPALFAYGEQAPGESQRLPRPFDGAPPLIPHSIDGLVPVTREENTCVMCHAAGEPVPDGPPHAPPSHFVDWRNAPNVAGEEIAGSRWVCTSCHVPQSDSPALVGNSFSSR